MNFEQIELIISLLQQMCVYVVIVYLLSKTPLFKPLTQVTISLPNKIFCYLIFSAFCIMGTYFGLRIENSIANTRATGAVLGGIVGGPWVGFFVGLTGGIHRYSMGGFTAFSCMLSTIAEGVLGGLVHRYYLNKHQPEQLFNPLMVFSVALIAECMQMSIIVVVAKPYEQAIHLVQQIALPMVLANSFGAAILMRMLLDRRAMYEKYSVAFSARALKIAERSLGVLTKGFNAENCAQLARILLEETNVGAVALTDREKLLAFIGIGEDHHLPGSPITSSHTFRAIQQNEVVYADGNLIRYHCSLSPHCKLGSTLVIPLRGEDNQVIGTIKLYEPKRKLFSSLNRTLGEGIGRLLSNQILAGKYAAQRDLLSQAEIKILHAQVNPHFLFNALNTISSIIRTHPEKARELVQNLSQFFRKNLRQESSFVSLEEELQHIHHYLEIEKARFASRLSVTFEIDDSLLMQKLPTFSLQPLVENAIKHGTSQMMEAGEIKICTIRHASHWDLTVEDNAGLYQAMLDKPKPDSNGLGMTLVDKRIKAHFGEKFGMSIESEPDQYTRIKITLPYTEAYV